MTALTQTITLTNDLAEIPRLADFVDAVCAPLDPTPKDMLALQLTLEEAVTNIINHGYRDGRPHTFTVALTVDSRSITAVVTDDAPAFDPLARPEVDTSLPIDQRPIGGLGVHLIKKLMHRTRYERHGDRNILTLEQQLSPTAPN